MRIRSFPQGVQLPTVVRKVVPEPPQPPPRLRPHGVERAVTASLYGGMVLPLLGSACAVAGQSPLRVASVALAGAALAGLAAGGIVPMEDPGRDPLSGWLRGAGMTATSLALGCAGGLGSMAVAAPLMGAAGYLSAGSRRPKEVKDPGLRALGWLTALATSVAAPVLVYQNINPALGVSIGMVSGLSMLMMTCPD